jgi:hypothetical protein
VRKLSKRPWRFVRAVFNKNGKSTLANIRTRKTNRIRLMLIVVLLLSIASWGIYAHVKASQVSETAGSGSGNDNFPMASDLYNLPIQTCSDLVPGNYDFVRSPGNPAYYSVVEHNAQTGENVTKGYVFITTDVAPSWSYGYSGPISILVSMDTDGVVLDLRVLSFSESRPSTAFEAPWLSTLTGKSVLGNYTIEGDIDSVTGATYTSLGVVNGIRESGRAVLKSAKSSSASPRSFSDRAIEAIASFTTPKDYFQSMVLLGLISVSVVGIVKKIELLRYGVLLGSLLLMEFMGTRMISIEEIMNLRSLSLPPLQGNLFWYLLFGSAFSLSLVWGRIYCGWLCPFGAATEFLNKLAARVPLPASAMRSSAIVRVVKSRFSSNLHGFHPRQLRIPAVMRNLFKRVSWRARQLRSRIPFPAVHRTFFVKYVILAAVVWGVVVAGNPVIMEVEPFMTFFFAEGTSWMWLLLFVVLVASLRVNRAFCRYLCPTGAVLSLLAWLRVREIKRWPECSTCRICERDCIMGGIQGTHIASGDCFNCGACERNYVNTQGCPHWLRLRSVATTTESSAQASPSYL